MTLEAVFTGDDDALVLGELLALFDDDDGDQDIRHRGQDLGRLQAHPPPSPSASTLSSSSSGNGSALRNAPPLKLAPRKRSLKVKLDDLRAETQQLTAQLDLLRHGAMSSMGEGSTAANAQETALTARFKRRRAEHARQQLRDALAANALFLRGLTASVLSAPPSFATGADLCLQLHNYTRLPRDRALRWQELAAMGNECHLRRAMGIVDRETQALLSSADDDDIGDRSLRVPRITVHESSSRNGFGVTTTSAFAVDSKDVGAVLRGACVAVVASGSKCRSYACSTAKQLAVDLEASTVVPNMSYRVTGVRQQSRNDAEDPVLLLEARSVTLYKETEHFAVVLWDYVDDDALHPTEDAADITRQAIGACVIRREICADGVERCVCRSVNTRRYHFLPRCSRASLESYERSSAPREHELLVHGVLVDALRREESVC